MRLAVSWSIWLSAVERKSLRASGQLGWLCSSDCALGREASRIPCQGVVNCRREGRHDGGVANELPNFKREVK
jgi:hypothetical protein